jgi:hypothetical protein
VGGAGGDQLVQHALGEHEALREVQRARRQREAQQLHPPVHEVQRHHQEQAGTLRRARQLARRHHVGQQVVVREHHALGAPAGARRVERQRHGLVRGARRRARRGRGVLQRGGALEARGARAHHDRRQLRAIEAPGLRAVEHHRARATLGQRGVDGVGRGMARHVHRLGPDALRAPERRDAPGARLVQQGHTIAGAHALGLQQRCGAAGVALELAPRPPLVAARDGEALGRAPSGVGQQIPQDFGRRGHTIGLLSR